MPKVFRVCKDFKVFKELQFKVRQVMPKVLLEAQDFKVSKVPREHLVFRDKQVTHKELLVAQEPRV